MTDQRPINGAALVLAQATADRAWLAILAWSHGEAELLETLPGPAESPLPALYFALRVRLVIRGTDEPRCRDILKGMPPPFSDEWAELDDGRYGWVCKLRPVPITARGAK